MLQIQTLHTHREGILIDEVAKPNIIKSSILLSSVSRSSAILSSIALFFSSSCRFLAASSSNLRFSCAYFAGSNAYATSSQTPYPCTTSYQQGCNWIVYVVSCSPSLNCHHLARAGLVGSYFSQTARGGVNVTKPPVLTPHGSITHSTDDTKPMHRMQLRSSP